MIRPAFFSLVSAILILVLSGCPALEKLDLAGVAKKCRPAVVRVIAYDADGQALKSGTGFFLNPAGQFMTTRSILLGAFRAAVVTAEGREYPVKAVTAEDQDAGLIQAQADLPPGPVPFLPVIGVLPSVGEPVAAVGYTPEKDQGALEGTVAALQELPRRGKVIFITISISPTANGGPVLNRRGKVLGVAASGKSWGKGRNVAIPGARVLALKSTRIQTFQEWTQGAAREGLAYYFEEAAARETAGKQEDSLKFYRMAVRFKADDTGAHNRLGAAYYKGKQYREAQAEFRRAAELKPDDAALRYNLGLSAIKLGEGEAAARELEYLKAHDQVRAQRLEEVLKTAAKTPGREILPELIKKIQPAIVFIMGLNAEGKAFQAGSGFFINKQGYFITNFHVMRGTHGAKVKTSDGKVYSVTQVLAVSPDDDLVLAAAQVPSGGVPFLPVTGELPQKGERVLALGAPRGLEQSASDGIISGIRDDFKGHGSYQRYGVGRILQYSSPTSPGSSGCAVVNLKGQVVAVHYMSITSGQNLHFGIPGARVLALKPGPGQTPEEFYEFCRAKAEELINQGQGFIKAKDYGKGIGAFKDAVNLAPDWTEPHVELGEAMVNRGLAQYALEPLQTAVKLDPKHARARFYLGEAYVRLGSLDKAQSQFLALTELDPERAVVLKKKMDAAREKSGKK